MTGDDDRTLGAIATKLAVLETRFTQIDNDLKLHRSEVKSDLKETRADHAEMRRQLQQMMQSVDRMAVSLFSEVERAAIRVLIQDAEQKAESNQVIENAVAAAVQTNRRLIWFTVGVVLLGSIVAPIILRAIGFH